MLTVIFLGSIHMHRVRWSQAVELSLLSLSVFKSLLCLFTSLQLVAAVGLHSKSQQSGYEPDGYKAGVRIRVVKNQDDR